jgi:type VI protein secretion system component Hcp
MCVDLGLWDDLFNTIFNDIKTIVSDENDMPNVTVRLRHVKIKWKHTTTSRESKPQF